MVQVNALNISGAQKPRAYRQEQNQANSAIASDFAGPDEPANPEAYMQWLQQLPGGDKLFRRNSSNTEWLEITPPFFKGGVMQVQHAVNDVERRFFNAGVFEPTGTEITITPSSLDSKILILVNQSYALQAQTKANPSDVAQSFGARVRRTVNGQPAAFLTTHFNRVNRTGYSFFNTRDYVIDLRGYQPITVLDSPNTLNPVFYEIFGVFREPLEDQGTFSRVATQNGGAESPSTITTIEVLT